MTRENEFNLKGQPWYKEAWGWFVFAPLFIVVIACTITVSIAVIYSDDVVKDEYIKTGKAYEKNFAPEATADRLNIRPVVLFDTEKKQIVVREIPGKAESTIFQKLEIHFLHPVKADQDLLIELIKSDRKNEWVADLHHAGVWSGRRYVQVQAVSLTSGTVLWRIKRKFDLSRSSRITFL